MTARAAVGHLVVAAGERVVIRRKHAADALDDYRWRRDPELARYDGREPLSISFSEFYERFERDLYYQDPTRGSFSIDTCDGDHIGNIVYYNVDAGREAAELGISLGSEAAQGQGYGAEAIVLFLRHIWETLPFRRVFLHTLEWNERAECCFQKAGFDQSARVFRQGVWYIRMEVRREWWLMWDQEGRFAAIDRRHTAPSPPPGSEAPAAG